MLHTLSNNYESNRSAKESSSPMYARSDTTAWSDYVDVARDYDDRLLNSYNRSLDVVLVFVSTIVAGTVGRTILSTRAGCVVHCHYNQLCSGCEERSTRKLLTNYCSAITSFGRSIADPPSPIPRSDTAGCFSLYRLVHKSAF